MDYKQLPDEIPFDQILEAKLYQPLRKLKREFRGWVQQNWFKLTFLGICSFFVFKKDISLNINMGQMPATKTAPTFQPVTHATSLSVSDNFSPKGATGLGSPAAKPARNPIVMTEKTRKQLAYVERFVEVAQEEQRKYNIPASITLAQGLIETNAGASPLATKNNNHFGIKCFSKSCKKGHCSNFSDDSHKDFFRKYKSAWESFRAHSQLLTYKRYKHLTKLAPTDYKNWATGLKKAGYATDPDYDKKLIHLIESLHLDKYDHL